MIQKKKILTAVVNLRTSFAEKSMKNPPVRNPNPGLMPVSTS